ncbi:restriction endonuclease subunit S [Streptococcus danieliae]|uniref:restriction endonuclease subunit S n=1 Tax=Streptococcus danieliae TaxID=747656 RepID=UPI0021C7159A|nr:restriction endonuclease subunit S [Streptococcus danieliae]MCU0083083.1 restriction endonuclease subunit S [Streptococcus danieliae]
MTYIEELIKEHCPNGVEWKTLGEVCKIETGKLNANAAVENGTYPFFTTAKEISRIDTYRWDTEALLIAGNANVGDIKGTSKNQKYSVI